MDTETTGKLLRNQDLGHKDQPDIIQVCAYLEENGKNLSTVNIFVDGDREIEEGAYEAHRISREMTKAIGISRRRMVLLMDDLIKKADVIVGHNIEFDLKMMLIAMRREGGSGKNLNSKASFCTMKEATDLCRIPSPHKAGEYKWPSLMEAYKALVDPRGFEDAHDAEADVRACQSVYHVLRKRAD